MLTLRELGALEGHSSDVSSLAFSPDGRRLVSGSQDHTIKIWDAGARRELTTLYGHTSFVHCLAFSPDGKTLATGGKDRTARLWRAAAEKEVLARGQ
jgi:WD40 repeat protein